MDHASDDPARRSGFQSFVGAMPASASCTTLWPRGAAALGFGSKECVNRRLRSLPVPDEIEHGTRRAGFPNDRFLADAGFLIGGGDLP
jgi:hypothetical protein